MTANAEIITQKQRVFCEQYIETGNASEAYRRAYDAENMSAESIKVEASRLLDNPNVALTVQTLQAIHAERHAVTVDSITKELDEARLLALIEKQTSSAVSASMGKAKLHGLIVDKKDIKVSPLESLLDEINGTSAGLPSEE